MLICAHLCSAVHADGLDRVLARNIADVRELLGRRALELGHARDVAFIIVFGAIFYVANFWIIPAAAWISARFREWRREPH